MIDHPEQFGDTAPSGTGWKRAIRHHSKNLSVRSREIATAKELLKEGYTSEQLLSVLACRSLDEKSQLWASGTIRDLLEDIRPGLASEAEDYEIDYRAWFITRRAKEIASTAEFQAKLAETFHKARLRNVCRA